VIYERQGKFDKSFKLHKKALRYSLRALGKEHPDVANTMNNVASIHMRRGEFDEALGAYFLLF
jgi:tetratricopeptide (TPR) repeat protein